MTNPFEAFFETDGDVFVGTAAARGPWSADHCHAGPVIGLIARAMERCQGSERLLTRLTVELIAPPPLAGLRVEARALRVGRTVAHVQATVSGIDDRVCATAVGMLIRPLDIGRPPTAPVVVRRTVDARPAPFPVTRTVHGLPCFSDHVQVLIPETQTTRPGPTTLWMKAPAIVAGETPSSFERLCPLADCGNGTSRNAEVDDYSFVNADLTIVRHRVSNAAWLGSAARSHWQPAGIGLAEAELFDEAGPLATVLQTLVVRPLIR